MTKPFAAVRWRCSARNMATPCACWTSVFRANCAAARMWRAPAILVCSGLCLKAALRHVQMLETQLLAAAGALKTMPEALCARIEQLQQQLKTLEKERTQWQ